MILARRNFLVGLFSGIVAAPAIVRASSLMPIRTVTSELEWLGGPLRPWVGGPPRCHICAAPFGMCAHTGGPISYTDREDRRLNSLLTTTTEYRSLPARYQKYFD